ncbi:MAG TPA: N-acetylmuramoyl-L-alanine amidase [Phycisphaerae bacterium]|nr:N-acetylmuramoyl-L-alanine amidase [Phycisphaerae bacterium]
MPVFERAAAEYQVPLPVLLVLARLGSGFEDRGAEPTIEGGYGLMALRDNAWEGDSLPAAARILQVEPETLKKDAALNIRGTAAVLDAYAAEARIDRAAGLDAWRPVVVRYAGLGHENSELFADEVWHWLAAGFVSGNRCRETFHLPPQPVHRRPGASAGVLVSGLPPDYQPAIWDPAPSCNYSALQTDKDSVVIHMAEGTAAGVRAWYKTCSASSSVHYVVSEIGTVWQMVRESRVAWHAGCYNSRSIGIIHEGFSASTGHPGALYQSSSLLCRHLCRSWNIPMQHRVDGGPGILGHSEATEVCGEPNVADPGLGWDWQDYIDRVNGGRGGPRIVAAVSRKEHGDAGLFDLGIHGASAIEPRVGGPTLLVITFSSAVHCVGVPVASSVNVSSGQVTAVAANGSDLLVRMNGAAVAGKLVVSFPGVVGDGGAPVSDALCFGVLQGDVNADGTVDRADLSAVRQSMQPGSPLNPRCDVVVDGVLNSFDLIQVRSRFGRSVTPCP